MYMKTRTTMTDHINDMIRIKEIIKSKNYDSDITETILESIEGCIENAKSHLMSERDQMRRIYNQGGVSAQDISSSVFFDKEYNQEFDLL